MFRHNPKKDDIPIETQRRMGRYIPLEKPQNQVHPVLRPFMWGERRLEWVAGWLQRLALLEILAIMSNVGILFAIVTYAATEKQRREEVMFTAWEMVHQATRCADRSKPSIGAGARFP
jgi:hypothetical protein